jgi:hypothetical protein
MEEEVVVEESGPNSKELRNLLIFGGIFFGLNAIILTAALMGNPTKE